MNTRTLELLNSLITYNIMVRNNTTQDKELCLRYVNQYSHKINLREYDNLLTNIISSLSDVKYVKKVLKNDHSNSLHLAFWNNIFQKGIIRIDVLNKFLNGRRYDDSHIARFFDLSLKQRIFLIYIFIVVNQIWGDANHRTAEYFAESEYKDSWKIYVDELRRNNCNEKVIEFSYELELNKSEMKLFYESWEKYIVDIINNNLSI